MTNKRPVSIFDVIGPIMVGPSSSHTAGAVRLGRMGRAILGRQPERAIIELHGSFAQTGQGHGTDKAIIAGLLSMPPADERLPFSFAHAQAAGLQFEFQIADLGDDAHPNTVRMTLSAAGETVRVVGASLGGGQMEINQIDDYDVRFTGEYETLLIRAEDRPGTVNTVTGWLLEHGVNVAFLRVERQKRGGDAIMIVEIDDAPPSLLIDDLVGISWVRWVRHVRKSED
ncbi:MAG: L-serine ammonia-lyase, iron-sulfur-dependent subunit beta [Phototrophicaceae bacterium]